MWGRAASIRCVDGYQKSSQGVGPTFLLGVGAQKAGTTWLYDYLARSDACATGFAKEMTIFDVLDVPEHTWKADHTFETATKQLGRLSRGEPADGRMLHRTAMMADTSIYFDYFYSLLQKSGTTLTLDITPNYALLQADRFRQIRDEFASRGVQTKVVFLMRDPVDRIWSQIRMHLRSRNRREPDNPHRRSEPDLVLMRHLRPPVELRTRYELTLENLDAAFPGESVHLELYERLFTEPATTDICTFLAIDHHTPDFKHKVNVSPRQVPQLPDDVVSVVAREYRRTYEVVAERMGMDDMSTWWPSSRLL